MLSKKMSTISIILLFLHNSCWSDWNRNSTHTKPFELQTVPLVNFQFQFCITWLLTILTFSTVNVLI